MFTQADSGILSYFLDLHCLFSLSVPVIRDHADLFKDVPHLARYLYAAKFFLLPVCAKAIICMHVH